MADDSYQSLPIQANLNQLASARALEAIEGTGRALPCRVAAVTGSMITVAFEVTGPWTLPPLTLPKAESQWLRAPTQIGDFGMTMPADTFLGGISGLGSGVADLTVDYGNMTTLVWVPVGSNTFRTVPDANKAWVNGPSGVVTSDTAMTVQTVHDNVAQAVSHVVPTGGKVGLGALAATLPPTAAALRNTDLSTFQSSLLTQRLNDQIALVNLLHTAGTITSGQLVTILAALVAGFLPGIGVPAGSATVFVKQ